MKISIILGTRPEIIKLSPIIREFQKQQLDFFIVHTNQHYSENMDAVFFKELELPQPKYNLGVGSGLHGEMTSKMLMGIEKVLIKEKPDWVIVQGDTNTVLAGALAASKLQIKVGHVEAGLRSYDRTMPEEINRILTDHISDALFCPTQKQADIVKGEGINQENIHVTGNTIVDAVFQNLTLIEKYPELNHYKNENYFLLTSHRPSNVDQKETLENIIRAVEDISKKHDLFTYFPIHPRTRKQMETFGIKVNPKYIKIMDPVGYLEMLALESNAKLILTDSGGIQEEACILNIPSVTLRENTERPETINVKASMLAGNKIENIQNFSQIMINSKRDWTNPFGDGKSATLIFKTMLRP